MRVVLQRVNHAQVTVDGEIVGKIGRGLLLLVAIAPTDTDGELDWLVRKCLDLRLFPQPDNPEGKWDCSVTDIQGEILAVSQFTLYGDCRKGRRPSFSGSAPPQQAETIYNRFVEKLKGSGVPVETGKFGANMQVQLENDGPVTLLLEREAGA
ncbi:MAG: D-tyrosyl-tRNA(Tyr) deacylase [Spirulina sp. SIO3F2]|nr:D-tyrosyl-tRNA(Tyr) deacylase [Spirulina sp. SIO3F2]